MIDRLNLVFKQPATLHKLSATSLNGLLGLKLIIRTQMASFVFSDFLNGYSCRE